MKDYATTESVVTPGAITAAIPTRVKGKTLKQVELMNMVRDLQKELVDSMETRDRDAETISVQLETIAELRGQITTLKKLIDRRGDENHREVRRGIVEIEALKALVKLYI